MIFLIACILELIICIASIFIPTVYTQDYSWIKIKDFCSLYKKESASQLTLLSYFDYIYIVIIYSIMLTFFVIVSIF